MLCISMKESAILKVGDDVDIYVQHIGGGQVRVCISAPRDVAIKHLPPAAPAVTAGAAVEQPSARRRPARRAR
jgi:hypothetical protein